MISGRYLFEWSLFALTGALFCLVLSFRPIPKAESANDTVRYVQGFHQYCAGPVDETLLNKRISYEIFYAVTSPACVANADGLFLFEVAAFLPMMFLLFARWRNGTFFWASGLMFSVFGLELMTNAMRQGLAMLLFFGAIALLQRHRAMALLLGLIAVAAHTSTLAFLPLLLWMTGARISRKTLAVGAIVALLFVSVVLIAYRAPILDALAVLGRLRATYSVIYADELKPAFVLFMVLPLYWVYGLRHFAESSNVSADERKAIAYSTLLLAVGFAAFPYIVYRFALFAVALQLFLVARSEKPGVTTGGYAFLGMLAHLSLMLAISNHFAVLLNG